MSPRTILKNTLPHFQETSFSERQCLIWIYLVTMASCRERRDQDELRAEMATRFLGSVRFWGQVEQVVRVFLWKDRLSTIWREKWEPD
jgi:hypothetical protein